MSEMLNHSFNDDSVDEDYCGESFWIAPTNSNRSQSRSQSRERQSLALAILTPLKDNRLESDNRSRTHRNLVITKSATRETPEFESIQQIQTP